MLIQLHHLQLLLELSANGEAYGKEIVRAMALTFWVRQKFEPSGCEWWGHSDGRRAHRAAAVVLLQTLTIFWHSTIKRPVVTACNVTLRNIDSLCSKESHLTHSYPLWRTPLIISSYDKAAESDYVAGCLCVRLLRCWDLRSAGWTGAAVCMARIHEPAHILHGRT